MNRGSARRSLASRVATRAILFLLTLLASGFLGAVLLRFAAGFDVDERDLDARYSAEIHEAIHRERAAESNVFVFYGRYLQHAVHGDLGMSRSLSAPVSQLIAARAGVTARLIAFGLLFGWVAGLGLAAISVACRVPAVSVISETLSGMALSLPAAVVALLIFLAGGPVSIVIGIAMFPRVFRYTRDLFEKEMQQSRVLAAKARGVAHQWILVRYVALPAWRPILALAGVCVSLAFGAAIPVEVICDIPGLGQLAWKAAMARDLPLLVSLTLIVTSVTLAANAVADLVLESAPAGASA